MTDFMRRVDGQWREAKVPTALNSRQKPCDECGHDLKHHRPGKCFGHYDECLCDEWTPQGEEPQ